jgi:hypothetical protein
MLNEENADLLKTYGTLSGVHLTQTIKFARSDNTVYYEAIITQGDLHIITMWL